MSHIQPEIHLPTESTVSKYTAILTQTGTNAPTAKVLHNTIGGEIIWARTGVGIYTGTHPNIKSYNTTITATASQAGTFISAKNGTGAVSIETINAVTHTDGAMDKTNIEINIYNHIKS